MQTRTLVCQMISILPHISTTASLTSLLVSFRQSVYWSVLDSPSTGQFRQSVYWPVLDNLSAGCCREVHCTEVLLFDLVFDVTGCAPYQHRQDTIQSVL